ncbi:MAG: DUF2442 domain-containing protein [Melioribacteraceae bacterium]|nr:DUF2442 domain-containing protein [Melioribacteraceae bacterium]
MIEPIIVEPLSNYKVFIEYNDGMKGELDITKLLKRDEYDCLKDENFFSKVYIDEKSKDICWNNKIVLCKDAIYKQLELRSLMNRLKIKLD